jgi:hypothetical protein
VTRLLNTAHNNASNKLKAATANGIGDAGGEDDEAMTPDEFAAVVRALPGGFINPKAVLADQAQANNMASAGTSFSWQELGPRTLNNGGLFPEPVSGRLLAVAFDPQNSQIIYVGSAQGGI